MANDTIQGVSNIFNMEPQRWPYNSIVKSNDQGRPKLLSGIPKLVPFRPIWGMMLQS